MRVLTSPDGRTWRCEEHPDGWCVDHFGFRVLERASTSRMLELLISEGVQPADLAVEAFAD